jgi:hypothetical protein
MYCKKIIVDISPGLEASSSSRMFVKRKISMIVNCQFEIALKVSVFIDNKKLFFLAILIDKISN